MRGDHSVDRSALLLTVLVADEVHILCVVDTALVRADMYVFCAVLGSRFRRRRCPRSRGPTPPAEQWRPGAALLAAGAMPEEVISALLPPDVQPQPMIRTTLSNFRVKLPTCIFGAMLTQKVKISLQSVSRLWRDIVRMPSMWLALSCRSLRGNAKQFLAHLKDARFAQVKAFALPTNKLTLDLCAQLQRHLPQVSAIDATKSSCWGSGPLEALTEGFASLLHLRLSSSSFDAACLRKLLARHGDLRALEVLAPAAMCRDLATSTFGGALDTHRALETLSLDFGSSHEYERNRGFDVQAAGNMSKPPATS